MGVVDVEPGAVGQDDVGHPGVVLGLDELLRDPGAPAEFEAACVTQRRLLLEVPGRSPCAPGGQCARVGVHHLRREQHRVCRRLAGQANAVFDLGAHDPADAHGVQATAPGRRSVRPAVRIVRRVPQPRLRSDRFAAHVRIRRKWHSCSRRPIRGRQSPGLACSFGNGHSASAAVSAATPETCA